MPKGKVRTRTSGPRKGQKYPIKGKRDVRDSKQARQDMYDSVHISRAKPAFNFFVDVPYPSAKDLREAYPNADVITPEDTERIVKDLAIRKVRVLNPTFKHGGIAHIIGHDQKYGTETYSILVTFSWG